jgi:putative membrane protein
LLLPYPVVTVDMGQNLARMKSPPEIAALWLDYVLELAEEARTDASREATTVVIGIHPFVVGTPDGAAAMRACSCGSNPAPASGLPTPRQSSKRRTGSKTRQPFRSNLLHPLPPRGSSMIKRYSDHAANERTFLAWVRTAIAVMAFGFIIERFDLFLKVAAPQLSERQLALHGERFANWAGLAFIVIGVITIVIAGLRFTKTAKGIESDAELPGPGARFDLALAIMIGLLGASLALYLSRAVLPTL